MKTSDSKIQRLTLTHTHTHKSDNKASQVHHFRKKNPNEADVIDVRGEQRKKMKGGINKKGKM